MDTFHQNWNNFLKEGKTIVPSREQMISIIQGEPNQKMHIDFPKGSMKKFGGEPTELEFDYGEWTDFINPADNMGWDFVIVPSGDPGPNLLPVGHVSYLPDFKKKLGNDKIIVAPDGNYTLEDEQIVDKFYLKMKRFNNPVWY